MHGFVRLTNQTERENFYRALKMTPWWFGGVDKAPDTGWEEIFRESEWQCVYCKTDLALSTDVLAESTEEHLVPRSLLEANKLNPNNTGNMASCCSRCNGLKNEFVPPEDDQCWAKKIEYVKVCKRFIDARRVDNFEKYKGLIEEVLKSRAGVSP